MKKGKKSAGVARQYSGTAGRIENSQIGVVLGYASRHGRVLLDRALYLPKDWAKDRLRRVEAPIPDDVAFATQPMLGLAMLERARASGVPFAWITGESVYGGVYALRQGAERHRCGSVLTVASNQHLGLRPVTDWIVGLGDADWQRLSAGDGAKGAEMVRLGLSALPGRRQGVPLRPAGAPLDLLPLTVPDIRHLLAGIVTRPCLDREQLFRWSEWRRRHQQRARRARWTRPAWKPPETRL